MLHLPEWINLTIALSLMVFGMGLITGRNGLIVLAGGMLSYYIITPVVKALGWIPADVQGSAISGYVYGTMTRPLGIGMLLGGSIAGLILSLPVIAVAMKSLAQASRVRDKNGNSEELPVYYLIGGAIFAFASLLITAYRLGGLFIKAERHLNRAWSAYADGYIREGDTYLESGYAQLRETSKLLKSKS
ncbi:hypothetical protein ADU37_CDS09540 [Thermococcus sp. 2319x1]|nr:hypothetical protein ADU37_CDS09540 [Thermococcus sp. 2319x1]